jgi:hypothetical protein
VNQATHHQVLSALETVADGGEPPTQAADAAGSLGLIDGGTLTGLGRRIVEDGLLKRRPDVSKELMAGAMASHPITKALVEGEWGQELSRDQVVKILRYSCPETRAWNDADFTRVLDSPNYAGLISYSRKVRRVRVLSGAPASSPPAASAPVSPSTPYRNKRMLAQIVAGARRILYWFDPHFPRQGLEFIYAEAAVGTVQSIRILSCGRSEATAAACDDYRRLRDEIKLRGTSLEWRALVDREDFTDKHDRWLLADDELWNLPPLKAILAGKWGTILRDESRPPLDDWWSAGVDVLRLT